MADPRSSPYDSTVHISSRAFDFAAPPEKQTFMATAAVEPSRKSYDSEPKASDKSASSSWPRIVWAIRYTLIVVIVGAALAIPIAIFRQDQTLSEDESLTDKQYRNLVFYLFAWLEITWLTGVVADVMALAFPYLFWLVSKYVNIAHQRYWRVFRFMRLPFTLLIAVIASFLSFDSLISNNMQLAVNQNKPPDAVAWDDVIDDVLWVATFWAVFYIISKSLMLYITIHYHYRADQTRNKHSKEMHRALVTLYEASVYLHPVDGRHFTVEDATIRDARTALKDSSRAGAGKFLARLGFGPRKTSRFFGSPKSNWLNPYGPYAVVERALGDPRSAAALATRIWKSLVLHGKDALTADDIAEVLGPYCRDDALECFRVLDENESRDIRLDEFVWTVVEAGRVRSAIYDGMTAIHHCINTLDWVAVTLIAVVMIFFIAVLYIPLIKMIQTTVSALFVGLGFALGRTVNKFLAGCIFVFFEHPFDIGDRVEVFNIGATQSIGCVVTGQSILYTVFRRLDNNTVMQLSNDRLTLMRLENVTRSGANKEQRGIFVNIHTPFVSVMALRTEMEAFLKAPENCRDYQPTLAMSVFDLHDLSRMELRFAFTHKHNWSNEPLRSKRTSRFVCHLMAAIRKIGITKPGGLPQGDESRPIYQVAMPPEAAAKSAAERARKAEEDKQEVGEASWSQTDAEADAQREAARQKREKAVAAKAVEEAALKKLTKVPEVEKKTLSTGDEVDTSLLQGGTGLRTRTGAEAGMMLYP